MKIFIYKSVIVSILAIVIFKVTIGSAISGLYGSNNVENSTTKTVSLNAGSNTFADYLSLSTLVTATDPDTDTANAAIANYFIG